MPVPSGYTQHASGYWMKTADSSGPYFFDGVSTMTLGGAINTDTAALVTLASASAGGNSADLTNVNNRGLKVVVNVTSITGTTPSLTVTIQGKDAASGAYYTLLASAAITAAGTTVLTVYPGQTASANVSANDVLPRTWRVLYAIAGTTPAVSATVGASLIV